MSRTLNLSPSSAILGSGLDYRPTEERSLEERRVHGSSDIPNTIIIIVISAILFIAVITIYDLIKSCINYYYSTRDLNSSSLGYTKQDKARIKANSTNILSSAAAFAFVTVVLAIVLVPTLLHFYKKK